MNRNKWFDDLYTCTTLYSRKIANRTLNPFNHSIKPFSFCLFFQIGRCGRTWKSSPPMTVSIHKKTIRLGIRLPPWQTPCIVVIHLHPELALTTARDFISQLQSHAPHMNWISRHSSDNSGSLSSNTTYATEKNEIYRGLPSVWVWIGRITKVNSCW